MAYFSLHAYDADVWIPEFRGLDQSDVGLNPDVRYAAEEKNMETPNGVLQPRAGIRRIEGRLSAAITMLTMFHRRWYKGSGTKNWFVCFSGGSFWYRQGEEDDNWTAIPVPTGVTFSDDWSYVAYEHTEAGKTVDVLLVTNKTNGMYMIIPPDRPTSWNDVKEHDWTWVKTQTWKQIKSAAWAMQTVNTLGENIGVIERYADRIWGADIEGAPDKMMYSKPYNPTDWNQDNDHPEDGGGEILQPSWDGDRFIALKQFGDQLIAFKEHHIWRIVGTNPGQFEFREQYGCGSVYMDSICVYNERLFMATENGIVMYDGLTVSPYKQKEIEKIWPALISYGRHCNATIYKDKYYLAFYGSGEDYGESSMVIVDFMDNTVLYHRGGIETGTFTHGFMQSDGKLYAAEPYCGRIRPIPIPGPIPNPPDILGAGICEVYYDSWETGTVYPGTSRWVSPWIDFGYKRIQKGGFDLYFIPEVKDTEVELKFTIQTEKKKKTKSFIVKPLTPAERAKPKEHRGKRLHFGGMGRKFRVIVEAGGMTMEGTGTYDNAPWRLVGGLQLVVETDPD